MKKIINLLLVLLIVLAFAAPVFAGSLINPSLPRVVDYGDLFTAAEEQNLADEITKLINKHGFDILIMTDTDHRSAADDYEYIEAIWDSNGFGAGPNYSGWAIFVCLQDRTWIHDTCGDANAYATYDTINIIDDYMEPGMVDGRYYDAMMSALSELDSLFTLGADKYVETTYTPIIDPPAPEKTFWDKLKTGGISGVIAGIAAGLINVGRAKSSMRTVSKAYTAGEYAQRGSFRLSRNEDILLNMYTRRIEKAQNYQGGSSGGGGGGGGTPHHSGGSTYNPPHVSSGGNVHAGGGGRKF